MSMTTTMMMITLALLLLRVQLRPKPRRRRRTRRRWVLILRSSHHRRKGKSSSFPLVCLLLCLCLLLLLVTKDGVERFCLSFFVRDFWFRVLSDIFFEKTLASLSFVWVKNITTTAKQKLWDFVFFLLSDNFIFTYNTYSLRVVISNNLMYSPERTPSEKAPLWFRKQNSLCLFRVFFCARFLVRYFFEKTLSHVSWVKNITTTTAKQKSDVVV